jgi:TPR repeat protein
MSGSVLLHRQRSPQDIQQLRAWYKIRDTLLGENSTDQNVKKALELASVCEHPNAIWLTKLFGGRDVSWCQEMRQVFLSCERDPRALCFAGLLREAFDEIRRAADLGDAFAQAEMAWRTDGQERFGWAEKSAAQGERDGFYQLGDCYRHGIGCVKDVERAKVSFLVAVELEDLRATICLGEFLDRFDPRRYFWFGRAAASGDPYSFLNEISDQIHIFNSGTEHTSVVFAIGRALKGHINNEKQTLFGNFYNFDTCIDP